MWYQRFFKKELSTKLALGKVIVPYGLRRAGKIFLFAERIKRNTYKQHFANYYFWRTYSRLEIDFIEEYGAKQFGYELSWGKKVKKAPWLWLETYTNSSFEVINKNNFLEFVC